MSENSAAKIPEHFASEIRSARRVALLTHVHPDGDALGSLFGLREILHSMGKETCVFLEEPVSPLYTFLPAAGNYTTSFADVLAFQEATEEPTIAIALDAGDSRRLGVEEPDLQKLNNLLVIDHHKSHRDFGAQRWVEPHLSSTGEMVYELAGWLQAEVSFEAAVNLYVAIITDTGSFRYETTGTRTLQVASELVQLGVKPDEIARALYDNVSLARIRLLREVLSTLKVYENGQLAIVHVTHEMVRQAGASMEDIEGFVDYPRSIGTVKVAVFIKEGKEGRVSVSLRAKGDLDVAEIASTFHGGGHRNAAGFRFQNMTVEQVHEKVLAVLQQRLGNG